MSVLMTALSSTTSTRRRGSAHVGRLMGHERLRGRIGQAANLCACPSPRSSGDRAPPSGGGGVGSNPTGGTFKIVPLTWAFALSGQAARSTNAVAVHNGYTSAGGREASGVHRVRNLVQPIAEQMAILIKGHGSAGVPQHMLDYLHVGAGCDGQRGRRVPELMRAQTRHPDGRGCLVEAGAPKDLAAQRSPTAHSREHEIGRAFPSHVRRQLIDQEPWDRHLTSLMTFRSTPDLSASDEGDGFRDQGSTPEEVDAPHAKGSQLAPTDAGVGQEQDDQPC